MGDGSGTRLTFSRRGGGLLLAGFLVLLLAFFAANILLFVVAVFLLGFVLAALLAFLRATRGFGPDAFAAERLECSSFARVRGSAFLSVRIVSRLPGSFYAEVIDRHPDRLRVLDGSPHLLTWWSAGEPLSLAYVVAPQLRGVFEVGPTVVVAHEPFGLAFRAVPLPSFWRIEAIPQPPTLPLGHPARIWNMIVGQSALATRGSGSEFHALREYQPGDEPRHIAWTRSGQGTLYSREYDRESQQDLVVLVDVGRPMAVGIGEAEALDLAVDTAADVLRASFDEEGRSGVLLFGPEVDRFVPAGRGSDHEFSVFRALAGAQVRSEASSFAGALEYLLPRLKRPTHLVAFTSADGDGARIAAACAALRRAGHRLHLLLPDVREMYPPVAVEGSPRSTDAFRLLLEPEVGRTQRAVRTLEGAGAAVGFFGRRGAMGAVIALYRRRTTPGVAA